jgi:hypothetical protein
MAANQSRTKRSMRQSIGTQLKAIDLDAGTIQRSPSVTSSGDNLTVHDNSMSFGGINEHRGKWVVATDTSNLTEIRRISGNLPDAGTFTVSVPFSSTPNTNWVYEVWNEEVNPISVHQYMDDATVEASRVGAVRFESDSMHYSARATSIGLGDSFAGVTGVSYRVKFTGEQLVSFDNAMSTLSANTHIATDSENYMEGMGAAKISVSSSEADATDIAASTFSATNLSFYDELEMWVSTNVATADTAQLRLKLYEGSSMKESIALPALNADSYTHVTLSLANPEIDTAITSVRLSTGSSGGSSKSILLDDLRAVKSNTAIWDRLHPRRWRVSQTDKRIALTNAPMPYSKLRVHGVKLPSLLTSDTQESDIDASFVINSVIAKHLRSTASRAGENIDAAFEQSLRYEALAQQQRTRMHAPSGVRWVDG